ncbi:MAG: 6-bladed beta-propeller [Pseudomonadota bacterium]
MRRLLPLLLSLYCAALPAADSVAHLTNISRAPLSETASLTFAGVDEFVSITNPVAVAAHENLVYIIDAAKQLVYRYNSSNENLTPLYSVNTHLQAIPNAIAVDNDGSFYLSDPFGRKILHFTMLGELLRTYQNANNLTNPVAINISDSTNILIADRLYDHILVFNRVGHALRAIGERGTGKGQFLQIIDMATGPDGIYILDRLSKSVKIFSEEGELIREMPRPEVVDPTAIAIDYAERVFISDAFDDTIKVYNRDGLLETFGGTGSYDGLFRMVSDLHADNNFLYVADSANDRVQVFLLKPAFDSEQDE